jgi:NAD kinase
VERALEEVGAWASANGLTVGQVQIPGQTRRVADPVAPAACDLVVALGGDGTALAALHAAAPSSRPVLGVACGSVGVLMSVPADRAVWALEEVAADRWAPVAVPGLEVVWGQAGREVAINDLAVLRDGPGQIIVSVTVDDVLYARMAGDGLVVATPLGSSAYTMAAGGPILAPGARLEWRSLPSHPTAAPSLRSSRALRAASRWPSSPATAASAMRWTGTSRPSTDARSGSRGARDTRGSSCSPRKSRG